jgi:hypothetical protein
MDPVVAARRVSVEGGLSIGERAPRNGAIAPATMSRPRMTSSWFIAYRRSRAENSAGVPAKEAVSVAGAGVVESVAGCAADVDVGVAVLSSISVEMNRIAGTIARMFE